MLEQLLDFLEEKIDLEHIEKTEELHKKALNFEEVPRLPINLLAPYNYEGEKYSMQEIHDDPYKMLYSQLLGCVNAILLKDDSIPTIRAHYGVGIMPSLFGAKSTIVGDNMPWVEHLSIEEIERIVDAGIPNVENGFGSKILETHKVYKEVLSKYPKLSRGIKIYHPDMQGSFDNAHLLWSSDIYIDMYERPELVHALLDLLSKTYIELMKKIWDGISMPEGDYNYHWGTLFKGKILLRNDSAVNVSKAMFDEFIKPYDEMILKAFDNGGMHFCGRADQIVVPMIEEEGLLSFNHGYMPNIEFGNTYLDKVFDDFKQRKVPLVQYKMTMEEFKELDKEKYKTGITLGMDFASFDDALKFKNEYLG